MTDQDAPSGAALLRDPDEPAIPIATRRSVLKALMATLAAVGVPIGAAFSVPAAAAASSAPARTFDLLLARKPAGTAYLWATEAPPGADGYEKMIDNLVALHNDGWRFVPTERHPEMASAPNPFGGRSTLVRAAGGSVLMERSQALQDAAVRAQEERTRAQAHMAPSVGITDEQFAAMRAHDVSGDDMVDWTSIGTYRPSTSGGVA